MEFLPFLEARLVGGHCMEINDPNVGTKAQEMGYHHPEIILAGKTFKRQYGGICSF
jgi:hypothetical protein